MTILEILKKKCAFKSIPVTTMEYLRVHPKGAELEAEWANMLAHQLPVLPSMEDFWQELPNLFDWLYGRGNKAILQTIPQRERDINFTWQPPSMIQPWYTSVPLELIRYAGANHLCVEIDYQKKDRTIKNYLIEPYDLKLTMEGHLLLMALKHPRSEWRAFRVSSIKRMEVTKKKFIPKYLISLTPFS